MDKYLKDLLNFLDNATEEQLKEEQEYISHFNYGPMAEDFVNEAYALNEKVEDYSKSDYNFEYNSAPQSVDDSNNFAKAA